LERRATVAAGEEPEGDEEPEAFSAALRMIWWMGSALVSAFVSTIIPMPSSTPAATNVDTPGAPPGWKMIYLEEASLFVTYVVKNKQLSTHIMA